MKDHDKVLRGACWECDCPEYATIETAINCGDCGHLVTHHAVIDRLTPLTVHPLPPLPQHDNSGSTSSWGAPAQYPAGLTGVPAMKSAVSRGPAPMEFQPQQHQVATEPSTSQPVPHPHIVGAPSHGGNTAHDGHSHEDHSKSAPAHDSHDDGHGVTSPPPKSMPASVLAPAPAQAPVTPKPAMPKPALKPSLPPQVNPVNTFQELPVTKLEAKVLDNRPTFPERFPAIVIGNLTVWWTGALLMGYNTYKNGPTNPYPKKGPNSDLYDTYCIWGYSLCIFFTLLNLMTMKDPNKRFLAWAVLACQSMGCGAYVFMVNRWDYAAPDVYRGTAMHAIRFLEWSCCCPILASIAFSVTKTKHKATPILVLSYIMNITGGIAVWVARPYADIWMLISQAAFMPCTARLWEVYTDAINGKTECKVDKSSLYLLRFATNYSWWSFTMWYFIYLLDLCSFDTYELGNVSSDMVAKGLTTLVLLNAATELVQREKMEVVEAANESLNAMVDKLDAAIAETDAMLTRLIPEDVVKQLKAGEGTDAREFEEVTVFFSDIVNYAQLQQKMDAKGTMQMLDSLWKQYDVILKKYGIYKVETIGDAFLGVAGCPKENPRNAEMAVDFAIDVLDMLKDFKTETGDRIMSRVGLNTGPVIAGLLGDLNPHYCIVGDTVNTASRMESTSKAGRIHITESTYLAVKDLNKFIFSGPEVMDIKGKGVMRTYWVEGRM
ncbi:Guanylate cyclase 2G [Gonapodya sp. JEL0774]|nr:Guanylate cyclase 2G [Gonapodya sp. JEL0774]